MKLSELAAQTGARCEPHDADVEVSAAAGLSDTKQDQACGRDAAEKPSAGKATAALISGTSSRCIGAERYVMAAGPALLIADEPSSALDSVVQAELVTLLDTLVREQSLSLLFITHDIALASLLTGLCALAQGYWDLVAYRTTAASPDSREVQRLYGMLLEGRIDAVTFTSPASVRRFADLIGEEQTADLLNTTVVAAIGPVTAAAAEQLGIKTTIVPATYTPEALVAALVDHFAVRV